MIAADSAAERATVPETVGDDFEDELMSYAGSLATRVSVEINSSEPGVPQDMPLDASPSDMRHNVHTDPPRDDNESNDTQPDVPTETNDANPEAEEEVPPISGDVPPIIPPEIPTDIASPDPEEPENQPHDMALSEVMSPTVTIPVPPTREGRAKSRDSQLYMEYEAPDETADYPIPELAQQARYMESLKGQRDFEINGRCETIVDSIINGEAEHAQAGEHTWVVHGSPLLASPDAIASPGTIDDSMNAWFKDTLPEGASDIRQHIEQELAEVPEPRALEAGGTGRSVFDQFTEGFFYRTIGANLTDTDTADTPAQELEQHDAARNHTVVTGDMMSPEVKAEIIAQNDGKKFDLIIERLYGGIETVPLEPFYVARQVADYYDMLSDKGIMIAQVMRTHVDMIEAWKAEIDANYPGLEVQIAHKVNSRYQKESFTVVRIQKRAGAPQHLPLLHVRSVVEWQRGIRTDNS